LRDRHHTAAGQTLQDAEQEQRIQIPGLRAQDRTDAKKGDILLDKRDTVYRMLVIGDDQCPPPISKPPRSLTTI
jgi:hypothetical protein